ESVDFESMDGTRLHGLFAEHLNPKVVMLFAHGRGSNVSMLMDDLIQFVQRHQVSVFLFDYRGFGRSDGNPTENGLYADARGARRWLSHRVNVDEHEIVLMGHSLGAAVMSELAAKDGAKGLIIENGFTNLAAVVSHHVPLLPWSWVLQNEFDSAKNLTQYKGPTLIAHGSKDEVIPAEHGVKLFEQAAGPKRFLKIHGGKHRSKPTEEFDRVLAQFINDLE
ncbi:MAG: alpha/beta hydrolase, partial [Planctomycetota bacterium]